MQRDAVALDLDVLDAREGGQGDGVGGGEQGVDDASRDEILDLRGRAVGDDVSAAMSTMRSAYSSASSR